MNALNFCFSYVVLNYDVCYLLIMIRMLGLFIVEQRLLPNIAGKRSYMAPTLVLYIFLNISISENSNA